MKKNNDISLLLVLSENIQIWNSTGFLDREIDYYGHLSNYFKNVYWLTYQESDLNYSNVLTPIKIIVLNKTKNIEEELVRIRQTIHEQLIIKTNQILNVDIAFKMVKNTNDKIVIRQGYYHPLRFRLFNKSAIRMLYNYFSELHYYKLADRIFLSSMQAKLLLKNRGINENKIKVLPNFINTKVFYKKNSEKKWDILFVGRLHTTKRIYWILSLLKKQKSIKALFIGKGKQLSKIMKFQKKYDVFLETIPIVKNADLPDFYNRTKVFILPSLFESNPKVLLEAMACGCLVIGANVYGINTIIQNGVNGFLVNNRKELYDIVHKLLNCNNPDYVQNIQKNAIITVQENNNLEHIIQAEMDYYTNLIDGSDE